MNALIEGLLYNDSGIKPEQASGPRPVMRRRSQFWIASRHLQPLYARMEAVDTALVTA